MPRPFRLPALLLAALLASALLSPARAEVPACTCWPQVPDVEPLICNTTPGDPLASFAFIADPPLFLQVVDFGPFAYCRRNAAFAWLGSAQAQLCSESLQCLCNNPSRGPERLCNGNDDDCDPGTPDCQAGLVREFEDPQFGVCKVTQHSGARLCGSPGGTPCRVCADGQFEYLYRVSARGDAQMTALAVESFSVPVPSSDVISAGFVQGNGSVAPSATTVNAADVQWDFLAPAIQPGQTSEDLFVCSFQGPNFDAATAGCQFGIDAPGAGAPATGLGPLVDCGLPAGPVSCPTGPLGAD